MKTINGVVKLLYRVSLRCKRFLLHNKNADVPYNIITIIITIIIVIVTLISYKRREKSEREYICVSIE